mmetsp:Transcript_65146/g.74872  ORF Transcript_65146/g.74872 Transcript_65146/m.74872 type:complete len:379 (+) Transcript_65146:1012-2148(+)
MTLDSLSESFRTARSSDTSVIVEDNLKDAEFSGKETQMATTILMENSTVSTAYSKSSSSDLTSDSIERPLSRSGEEVSSQQNDVKSDEFLHKMLRISYETKNLNRHLNAVYNSSVLQRSYTSDLEMFLTQSTPVLEHNDFKLKELWTGFEEASCFGVGIEIACDSSKDALFYYPQLSGLHVVPKKGAFKQVRGSRGNNRREVNYFEVEPPFMRLPFTSMIDQLSSKFSELNTLRASEIDSSSWLSILWQPVHRSLNPQYGASFLVFYEFNTDDRNTVDSKELEEVEKTFGSLFDREEFMKHTPRFLKVKGVLIYRSPEDYWCISYGLDRNSQQVDEDLTNLQMEMLKNSQEEVRQLFVENPSMYHPDYSFISSRPYYG